jgi:hypothetical protein
MNHVIAQEQIGLLSVHQVRIVHIRKKRQSHLQGE